MKSHAQHFAPWLVVGALIIFVGCNSEEVGKNSEMGTIGQAIKKPPAPPPQPAAAPQPAEQPPVQTPPPQAANPRAPQPAQGAPPQVDPRAAQRGAGDPVVVGKKQHPNEVHGVLRYYGAIASARFVMEDRIFGAQIQKTLDLYVAGNDGKYPKTNDEYMDKIIHEGMIQLPELPPGQEYFYDPQDHELKIGTLEAPPAGQPPQPQ